MILPRYHISTSTIPGAGKGLFLDDAVRAGDILVAPDDIRKVYKWRDIEALPNAQELLEATVRWFGDCYTISTDWPDECYVNHAFEPNGLWHLGFIFAATDLAAGAEITVDYRHLLAPGQEESFRDAHSGKPIVGWTWHESLSRSTAQLQSLLARSTTRDPVPA